MHDLEALAGLPEVSSRGALTRVVHGKSAAVLFVYSPSCYWSQVRAPEWASATRGLRGFWRFNAVPQPGDRTATQMFQQVLGPDGTIQYYPMILGISRQGRIVEYNGELERHKLQTFLAGLNAV